MKKSQLGRFLTCFSVLEKTFSTEWKKAGKFDKLRSRVAFSPGTFKMVVCTFPIHPFFTVDSTSTTEIPKFQLTNRIEGGNCPAPALRTFSIELD